MTELEKIYALREHKGRLLEVLKKAIDEASWNAQRYQSEDEYEKMLHLKTIKYIIEDL
tara:strand:+ start:654 stop:827 length:174 start_codon:yes stop_codon:yes gene_type:complete